MKKLLFLLPILGLMMTGCNGGGSSSEGPKPTPTGLTVKDVTVNKNRQELLSYKILPDGASEKINFTGFDAVDMEFTAVEGAAGYVYKVEGRIPGEYEITATLETTTTVSTTFKVNVRDVGSENWILTGTFNGWPEQSEETKLVYDADADRYVIKDVDLVAGDKFKIKANEAGWNHEINGTAINSVTPEGCVVNDPNDMNNVAVVTAGLYEISLNSDSQKFDVKLTGSSTTISVPNENALDGILTEGVDTSSEEAVVVDVNDGAAILADGDGYAVTMLAEGVTVTAGDHVSTTATSKLFEGNMMNYVTAATKLEEESKVVFADPISTGVDMRKAGSLGSWAADLEDGEFFGQQVVFQGVPLVTNDDALSFGELGSNKYDGEHTIDVEMPKETVKSDVTYTVTAFVVGVMGKISTPENVKYMIAFADLEEEAKTAVTFNVRFAEGVIAEGESVWVKGSYAGWADEEMEFVADTSSYTFKFQGIEDGDYEFGFFFKKSGDQTLWIGGADGNNLKFTIAEGKDVVLYYDVVERPGEGNGVAVTHSITFCVALSDTFEGDLMTHGNFYDASWGTQSPVVLVKEEGTEYVGTITNVRFVNSVEFGFKTMVNGTQDKWISKVGGSNITLDIGPGNTTVHYSGNTTDGVSLVVE